MCSLKPPRHISTPPHSRRFWHLRSFLLAWSSERSRGRCRFLTLIQVAIGWRVPAALHVSLPSWRTVPELQPSCNIAIKFYASKEY